MTTAFAIGVLVVAAGCGVSFVWWMFSGVAAWIEPDDVEMPAGDVGVDDRERDHE